jgi:hypothetical protein
MAVGKMKVNSKSGSVANLSRESNQLMAQIFALSLEFYWNRILYIRGLNLAAAKRTTVQASKLPL